ncbi:MAG: GNAT family acetyltransferase [Lachnospiraceae bacterium]|nr:GNAT family acetyltransferase [Lachnospiraceae bacterium]
MNAYTTVNILDMIKGIGEDGVRLILSDFSCPKNAEIEKFVKKSAIDFAKKKMSITHLVIDEQGKLVAIFTLAHKALEIGNVGISESTKKKIRRYAQLNADSNSYMVSAFLIAQFGKDYSEHDGDTLSGNELMECAMEVLRVAQHDVGGGIVYLECEDKPQLLKFYQNDNNFFRIFGERYSDIDKTKYIQLLRFF